MSLIQSNLIFEPWTPLPLSRDKALGLAWLWS